MKELVRTHQYLELIVETSLREINSHVEKRGRCSRYYCHKRQGSSLIQNHLAHKICTGDLRIDQYSEKLANQSLFVASLLHVEVMHLRHLLEIFWTYPWTWRMPGRQSSQVAQTDPNVVALHKRQMLEKQNQTHAPSKELETPSRRFLSLSP